MKSLLKMIGASALTLGIALAAVGIAPHAQAIDKLTLKDGRSVEGEIIREQDGVIWLKTAGGTIMYTPSEYTKLERSVDAASDANPDTKTADGSKVDAPASVPASDAGKTRKPGVPRAAVITYGDEENGNMVGIYATAAGFREAIKYLEEEKIDIAVIRFKSGGGLALEVQKFSDLFHLEYKPKFRTVAWIDSAISAAAMSAHAIEEIYFTPQGNYGACTGFSGALNAMKGRSLEQILYDMEKISARGGYSPYIMRAMQISSEEAECAPLGIAPPTGALSADIDEDTGKVTWYPDKTSGKYVLNPSGGVHILTFNSETASKFKFSKGTASNIDELTKAMGLTEVEWVGKQDKRFTWPVCKAEEYMLRFRVQTKQDETHFRRYYANFVEALGRAQAQQDPAERGKFLGKAREALGMIENMVKNNSNFILLNWGEESEYKEWLEEMKKIIKDLARR